MRDELVALRRQLHRIPELGFEEWETSRHLRERLEAIGPVRRLGDTGLVLDLGSECATKTLLLRADMDGLPILEQTGLPYASVHEGKMHACGHDAHMAILMVVGEHLAKERPPELRVRLLFQPAEEGAGGAAFCIEQGVLEGVDAAFGLHVWNELPVGQLALRAGGIMASVVELTFDIGGQGGHAALPERAINPLVASAQLITSLEPLARQIDESLVMTLTALQAGDAFNVIADTCRLKGTVRAFSEGSEARLEAAVRETCKRVAQQTGVSIELDWRRHCRVTSNDADFSQLARNAASGTELFDEISPTYRTPAGEDFGEFLVHVPGAYALIGSGRSDGSSEPHHSPRFEIEEDVLELGAKLHLAVVDAYARSVAAT